jgi:hypothetical protein
MRPTIVVSLVCALVGCKRLTGTQRSTDHYVERAGSGERIGDVQVTSVADGDTITISFAAPDVSWKDPRPQRIADGLPTARVAEGGCKVTAKREDGKKAKVQETECTIDGRSLRITQGMVWVKDDVLNVDLMGKIDRYDYSFQFPYQIGEPPLKMK